MTTLALRSSVTFPLAIKQNFLLTKMELLKPTLMEITEALKHNIAVKGQRAGKSTGQVQKELRKEVRNTVEPLSL